MRGDEGGQGDDMRQDKARVGTGMVREGRVEEGRGGKVRCISECSIRCAIIDEENKN